MIGETVPHMYQVSNETANCRCVGNSCTSHPPLATSHLPAICPVYLSLPPLRMKAAMSITEDSMQYTGPTYKPSQHTQASIETEVSTASSNPRGLQRLDFMTHGYMNIL